MPIHTLSPSPFLCGRSSLLSALAILGIASSILTGCGGGGPTYDAPVAVSGKVTLKGQLLTGGTIHFSPIDPKTTLPGSGQIQSDGGFKVTTTKPDDGLTPGKYNVFIDPAVSADGSKKGAPSDIPLQYLAPTTSKVIQVIDKPTSTLQIVLK